MGQYQTNGLHSFIWDSENYYLKSTDFVPTSISGSNKKSFVFINTNYSLIAANMTLCSIWRETAGNRSFLIRVTSTGKLQYLQSSGGTSTDIDVVTTNSLSSTWQSIIITVDPTQSGASNVVKIYFDNTVQTLTANIDTGTYTANSSSLAKLTLGCHFDSSSNPADYYLGYINQFVITSDIITSTEASNFYNSGIYKIANDVFDNLVIGANFDYVDFTGRYLVYDLIGTNHFLQYSTNSGGNRTSHWCQFLNPKGIDGGSFTDNFQDDRNFFTFFGGLGTNTVFGSNCTFNINHTDTVDQDRNSHETLSKMAFDLNIADLWVGYTYDYAAAAALPHSHGGASVIDCRNDNTDAVWTHRSLVNNNNTYRVLIDDDNASQVDFESSVAKNNQVWTHFHRNGSNCEVKFYWNNSNTLTQIWTTQTLIGVRHLRLKFHARDYNLYNNPNSYTFSNLRVTRSTPSLP